MARDTLWIMAASLLTAYSITDPLDMDGKVLTADSHLEYTNAMVRSGLNFKSIYASHKLSSFPPHIRVSFRPRIPTSIIYESVSE
jgi:hypothetical protein